MDNDGSQETVVCLKREVDWRHDEALVAKRRGWPIRASKGEWWTSLFVGRLPPPLTSPRSRIPPSRPVAVAVGEPGRHALVERCAHHACNLGLRHGLGECYSKAPSGSVGLENNHQIRMPTSHLSYEYPLPIEILTRLEQ